MARTAEPATLKRSLAETAARIEAVARRLTAAQLTSSPMPGGWSPNDILWHIRATADVYGEQIARILGEDEPRWRHASPRARMKKTNYNQLPFAESFAAFVAQREALVRQLKDLPPEAWQRFALVKVDYKPDVPWRLSLNERVSGMANHEHIHCAEMEQAATELSAI